MRRQTERTLGAFGKSFGITLFAMLVVLSAVCGVFYLRTRLPRESEEELPVVYLPRSDDRITVLVTGREDDRTPPDLFLLLGFLPDQGRIALCLLPPATSVDYGGEAATLAQLYQRGGCRYVQQALAAWLEIPVDRWAEAEVEDLERIFSVTGLMDYYLPVDLNGQVHGREVVMPKGNYQLDGRKAADIMAYPAYKGGEVERSDRAALLLSQMLGETLPAFLTDLGDSLMATVLETVDTDLSWKDYEERRSAAAFLARLDLPATAVAYIDGSFSRDGAVFYLNPDCIARIREMYAAPGEPPQTEGDQPQPPGGEPGEEPGVFPAAQHPEQEAASSQPAGDTAGPVGLSEVIE